MSEVAPVDAKRPVFRQKQNDVLVKPFHCVNAAQRHMLPRFQRKPVDAGGFSFLVHKSFILPSLSKSKFPKQKRTGTKRLMPVFPYEFLRDRGVNSELPSVHRRLIIMLTRPSAAMSRRFPP